STPPICSGKESASGVTNRLAPRLRNSWASRSPTSSETLSAAVATALPSASAAMVSNLRRGRRVNESATSRRNIAPGQKSVFVQESVCGGNPREERFLTPQTSFGMTELHFFCKLLERLQPGYFGISSAALLSAETSITIVSPSTLEAKPMGLHPPFCPIE